MTAAFVANVAAYSLQLGVVAAVAAGVTWAYPIGHPQRAHRFWQSLVMVAMALPLMALWRPGPALDGPAMVITSVASSSGEANAFVSNGLTLAAQVLAAGAVVRLAWLIIGMAAVRRYVRRAVPVEVAPTRGAAATASVPGLRVCLSSDVRSPVTVGVVRPVVLLPWSWTDLDDESARAILRHETLHVQRRDWLRVCAEEVWCAVLWFHPGARLLVTRLDTAREMLVDQHVVRALGDWRAYARTLMAFSDAGPSPHPAASLIRPRHLPQRIQALSEEANMTRRERRWTAGVAIAVVAAVTVGTVWAMPMPGGGASAGSSARAAQDEVFEIGNGVTSPRVTHEVKANYTKPALDAKIQGAVWLSVVVKKDGTVGDVQVRQSLDTEFGLDDSAVAAMRQWTFEPARRNGEAVAVRVTVEMRFTLKD